MFGNKVEIETTEAGENTGTKLGLAACDGARAVWVVGRVLRAMNCSPGMAPLITDLPLPPGEVVDVSPNGPSVLVRKGRDLSLWWFHPSTNTLVNLATVNL